MSVGQPGETMQDLNTYHSTTRLEPRRLKRWLWGSAAALALSAPTLAMAAEAESPNTLAEIVVTAQKRAQNLQDVPIAVTALSQDSLQANRVVNVQDLNGLAPNVVIRPSAGGGAQPAISMRGLVAIAAVPGSDKEVSINLDGVYISATRGTIFELPDIERIEVLRGPQGTLFGRNTTTGAISIVTRDPKGVFGVRQEFTVGNYAQLRSRTSIDFPAWGPLSAYVTYLHNERQGDIKNLGAGTVWDRTGPQTSLGTGVSPGHLGDHDTNNVFAAVRFAPTDAFEMVYKFDYSHDHFTPEGVAPIAVNPAGAGAATLVAVLATQAAGGGPYGPIAFAPDARRPKAVNNFWDLPGNLRNSGHSLTAQYRLSDSISFKNIAAYRSNYLDGAISEIGGIGGLVLTQAGATRLNLPASSVGQRFVDVATNTQTRSKQWSDELQLNYDSKLVTLTTGAIWFHSKDQTGVPIGIRTTSSLVFFPATGEVPLGNTGVSYNFATSYAAYGQAEVHVSPQVDVVLGGRLTKDKKHGRFESGGVFQSSVAGCPVTSNPVGVCRTAGVINGLGVSPFTYEKTTPTYSVGTNYKPTDDILAYIKYSTGYVAGGAIGGVSFEPEKVRSIEAGGKGDFLDRRLRTNLAVFQAKYKAVQTSQSGRNVGRPDLSTVVVTGYDEKATGFEFEATALPISPLTLGASLGYTHTKLSNVRPLILTSVSGPIPATRFVQGGIPKWTANLSAQYDSEPLFGDATARLRIDANYRSKLRNDQNPDRAAQIPVFAVIEFSPAQWLVNARASIRHIKLNAADAELAVWARNLTNNRSPQFPLTVTFSSATSFQQARTYGMDLILTF